MSYERKQPSDIQLRQTYLHAIRKGRELFRELKSFRVRPSSDQLLTALYKVETGHKDGPQEISTELAFWKINIEKLLWIDVTSRGKNSTDTAYSHHVKARNGLLLTSEVDKDRDMNKPASQLKPSEVAWQSFVLGAAVDGVPSSRIRCLVMHCIVNENTKDVIFETSRTSSSTLRKTNNHKEYTNVDERFYALLGSVLGKSAVHMLLDHKSEIGYRLVERVVLLGREDLVPGLQWEQARTLFIILSEPRPRKRAASELPYSVERSPKRRRLSHGGY